MSLISLPVTVLLGVVLAILSVCDLREGRLPNQLTLPLLAGGLLHTMTARPDVVVWHIAGAAAGYLCLYGLDQIYLQLRGRHGVGGGDAKLLAAAGAWLGILDIPNVLLLAALLGLITVAFQWSIGKAITRTSVITFGPFLSLAFWTIWVFRLNEL